MINLKDIERSAKFKTPLPITEVERRKIKEKEKQAKREAEKAEKKEKELQFILAQKKLDDVISNIKDKNSREYTDSDFPMKINFSIPKKDVKNLKIDKDFKLLQIDDNDSFYIYPKVIENVFLGYLKNAFNIFRNTNKRDKVSLDKWKNTKINFLSKYFFFACSTFLFNLPTWLIIYGFFEHSNTWNVLTIIFVSLYMVCIPIMSMLELYLLTLPLDSAEFNLEDALQWELFFFHYDYKKEKNSKVFLLGLLFLLGHIINGLLYPIILIFFFVKDLITLKNLKKELLKEKENELLSLKKSPYYFDELIGARKYTIILLDNHN